MKIYIFKSVLFIDFTIVAMQFLTGSEEDRSLFDFNIDGIKDVIFRENYFQGRNCSQKYVSEPALFNNQNKYVTDWHYSFYFGRDLLQHWWSSARC